MGWENNEQVQDYVLWVGLGAKKVREICKHQSGPTALPDYNRIDESVGIIA